MINYPCYKRNNFPEKKFFACILNKRSSAGFSYPKVLVVIRQTYHSWMIAGSKRDLVLSEEKLFIQKVFFVAKKGRDYLVVVSPLKSLYLKFTLLCVTGFCS